MPDPAITFEIDDSEAIEAQERTNKGFEEMARKASRTADSVSRSIDTISTAVVRAASGIGRAIDATEHALLRTAQAAGAVYLGFKAVGATIENFGRISKLGDTIGESLLNVYRISRLVLSPTLFTGAAIGAGILLERLAAVSREYSHMLQQQALLAAKNESDFSSSFTLSTAGRIQGVDLAGIAARNDLTASQVSKIATEFADIKDPVERARRAVAVFGEDAGTILPVLDHHLVRTIDSARGLADTLDGPTRIAIANFGAALDEPGRNIRSFRNELELTWERAKQFIVAKAAGAFEFQQGVGRQVNVGAFGLDPKSVTQPLAGPVTDAASAKAVIAALTRDQRSLGLDLAAQNTALDVQSQALDAMARFDSTKAGIEARLAKAKQLRAAGADLLQSSRRGEAVLSRSEILAAGGAVISGGQQEAALQAQLDAIEAREKRIAEQRRRGEALVRAQAGVDVRNRREAERDFQQATLGVGDEVLRGIEDEGRAREAVIRRTADFSEQTERLAQQRREAGLLAEARSSDQIREQQLVSLGQVNARTVQEKLALEQAKLGIEIDFLRRSEALQLAKIKAEARESIREAERQGIVGEELERRRAEVRALAEERSTATVDENSRAIVIAQRRAAVEGGRAVNDELMRTYGNLKRSAEGVIDALISKTESFGEALARIMKAAILTPIKEILSSQIALALTKLLTGQQGSFSSGSGVLGGLGQLGLGSAPSFGGGSSSLGALAGLSSLGGFGSASAPGGTGTFTGAPVSGIGGAGRAGGLAGLGGLGGLFFNSGSISLGAGSATTAAGIGGFGGALAGLATSPAALLGGGLLAAQGVKMGGKTGAGLSIGGGALAGAAVGTLIFPGLGTLAGAAIGAIAGGVASLIRSFVKSAEEKMIEKVKAAYDLTIDRSYAKTLVAIAKQNFGGNIDVAIRSPQVVEMLELYAMASGQHFGARAKLRPVSLVETRAGLFQEASFQNGQPLSFGGSLPVFGGLPTNLIPTNPRGIQTAAPAPAINLQVVMEPKVTVDNQITPAGLVSTVEVAVVKALPKVKRLVSDVMLEATQGNYGRGRLQSLVVAPGERTSL